MRGVVNFSGGKVADIKLVNEQDIHILEARLMRVGSNRPGRRVAFKRVDVGVYEARINVPKTPGEYYWVFHTDDGNQVDYAFRVVDRVYF